LIFHIDHKILNFKKVNVNAFEYFLLIISVPVCRIDILVGHPPQVTPPETAEEPDIVPS